MGYYRGDYYEGDYYQGGFPLLFAAGTLIKKFAPKIIGKAGALVGKVGGKIGRPARILGGAAAAGAAFEGGSRLIRGRGGEEGEFMRRRRMNVANPKALRRAIRRARGFAKLARKVLTYPIAKPPRGRALFKKAARR